MISRQPGHVVIARRVEFVQKLRRREAIADGAAVRCPDINKKYSERSARAGISAVNRVRQARAAAPLGYLGRGCPHESRRGHTICTTQCHQFDAGVLRFDPESPRCSADHHQHHRGIFSDHLLHWCVGPHVGRECCAVARASRNAPIYPHPRFAHEDDQLVATSIGATPRGSRSIAASAPRGRALAFHRVTSPPRGGAHTSRISAITPRRPNGRTRAQVPSVSVGHFSRVHLGQFSRASKPAQQLDAGDHAEQVQQRSVSQITCSSVASAPTWARARSPPRHVTPTWARARSPPRHVAPTWARARSPPRHVIGAGQKWSQSRRYGGASRVDVHRRSSRRRSRCVARKLTRGQHHG